MQIKQVVTYKSAQAYYHVKFEDKHTVVAELQGYSGKTEHMPPKKVVYIKSDAPNQPSLLDDMSKAMRMQDWL